MKIWSELPSAQSREVVADAATVLWLIFWASSIPGRFPATDSIAQNTSRGVRRRRRFLNRKSCAASLR